MTYVGLRLYRWWFRRYVRRLTAKYPDRVERLAVWRLRRMMLDQ